MSINYIDNICTTMGLHNDINALRTAVFAFCSLNEGNKIKALKGLINLIMEHPTNICPPEKEELDASAIWSLSEMHDFSIFVPTLMQAAKGTNNHHALSISKMLAQYHITHGSSAIIHHDLLELLLSNPDDNVHINATNALVAIPDKSQIKNEIEFLFNDENRMRRNNAFLALQGEMNLAPYSDKIIDACASDMPHNAYVLLNYTTDHSESLDTIFDARVLEDLGGICPIKRGYAQAIISKIKDPSRFVAPLHELVANCAINTPGAISALTAMTMWKGDPMRLRPALEIGVTSTLNSVVQTTLKVVQLQRNPCDDFLNAAQKIVRKGRQTASRLKHC